MVGLGTIVNTIAVLAGGFLGLFFKSGLKPRFAEILMQALGTSTMFIGLSGAMRGLLSVQGGQLETRNALLLILCLVPGVVIGEWINIDLRLTHFGDWLKKKVGAKDESNTFVHGFVSTTLIICVGAMAIVGAFEDALLHNYATLFAKSALDAVLVLIFASTFGVGVVFSAIPLFLYQGALTVMAGWLEPILTDTMISNISFIGSVMIFLIGVNLLFDKKIRIGNFLPSLIFAVILPLIWTF